MALHVDVPSEVPELPVELVYFTEDTATLSPAVPLNARLEAAVETKGDSRRKDLQNRRRRVPTGGRPRRSRSRGGG